MTYTLALCQMPVAAAKADNIKTAQEYIETAAKQADIVILPEMWCCPYEASNFPIYAESADGPLCSIMSEAAKKSGKLLIAGSVPESENGKVYNTSFVYGPDGALIARHRKAHLFDINIEGGIRFCESDTLSPGNYATVFDTPFGKIGLGICYDIRFFHLADMMALAGADVLVYPGCFNMTTGPAHWHLTLRSRAVDNQAYTVGVCSARSSELSYTAFAHSLCCDPWGSIIAEAGTEAEIVYAVVDTEYIAKIRRQLPFRAQRRSDLTLN
jgi:predicted amidohydrolase